MGDQSFDEHDVAEAAFAVWNTALIHLGRAWRKSMIHYEPEGLHDIDKAVYALWRGEKNEEVGEEIGKMLRAPNP